jgi:hypothetical protein
MHIKIISILELPEKRRWKLDIQDTGTSVEIGSTPKICMS